MERAEHIAWCKQRALEYLDQGDVTNAIASMCSDLAQRPDTTAPVPMLQVGLLYAIDEDCDAARRWINGFN
jgi:hypothetical protein